MPTPGPTRITPTGDVSSGRVWIGPDRGYVSTMTRTPPTTTPFTRLSRRPWMLVGAAALTAGTLAACGGDDATIGEQIDSFNETVQDETRTAWASFETNFERVVDEARAGVDGVQADLLSQCRDLLQDLRADNDPAVPRVEALCDSIRDADGEAAWDQIRAEVESIDQSR